MQYPFIFIIADFLQNVNRLNKQERDQPVISLPVYVLMRCAHSHCGSQAQMTARFTYIVLWYNISRKKRTEECGMSEQITVQNEQSSTQIIAALRSRVAVLEEELALVQEQLVWLKKQVFGRKTEQSSVIMDNGQQLTLFQDEQGQPTKPAEETITVPVHKRKKKRTHDEWMSKLPVEEIEHKEEHPICENCGAEMKEIGKEKAYDELVFTPASILKFVQSELETMESRKFQTALSMT